MINIAVTGAIAILSIVFLTTLEHNSIEVNAQTNMTNNTLFVTGSAVNQTKPDKVAVSLGVETTNSTAQVALASNSDLMNKVLNALKAAGVQENETSTSTFSITPNYNYTQDGTKGKLTGFTVANSIQIESTNVGNISEWIDSAVSSGANNVESIYFTLSDKNLDNVKNSLLKEAIDSAKKKADVAASAVGLKVIGIKSISVEQSASPPPPPIPFLKAETLDAATASSTPIISGQQEVSVSVNIVYFMG